MAEINKPKEVENKIDLEEIFFALLDKIWPIFLTGVITAILAFGWTKFTIVPVYQATTKVYVLTKAENSAVSSGDLSLSSQLIGDCSALFKSRPVTSEVIRSLGLNMSTDQLAAAITINTLSDTRIVNITVSNSDPQVAMKLANQVREVGAEQVAEIMNLQSVNLVEEALMPTAPISPDVKKNTLMGGMAGIVLAALAVVLMFILNDTIHSEEDVERYLGLSVLGAIPLQEQEGSRQNYRRGRLQKIVERFSQRFRAS